jgi:hypothetical protein
MNNWVKGLFAALITGAANAVVLVVVDPINFPLADLSRVGTAALVSGLIGAAAYLKQSPLPTDAE